MTDGPMSREALLAGLRDIRLPPDAPGGWLAEALAAAGLGLVLAALAALAVAAVTSRARPVRPAAPAPAASGEEARRLALLRRLKAERPERFAPLAARIYEPGGLPDAQELERMLAAP